jgi:peptide/nickel transport system substrate-binding protein
MHSKFRLRCFAVLALLGAQTATHAQDFAIGLATPLTTLDPHERNDASHHSAIDHVFETLVGLDSSEAPRPALAESWKPLNALTWEFKLRKGVVWHDGSAFTVDDVIASLNRVAEQNDGAASFAGLTRRIESVGRVNAHTLFIRTRHPHALLLGDLAAIRIVKTQAAAPAATATATVKATPTATPLPGASAGPAALLRIGTGPYRLKEFVPGERVVLERNDAYWGAKAAWPRLQLRFISSAQARVFALLAGDVQMIEGVSPADQIRLAKEPRVQLVSAVTNRLIYLHVDSSRDSTPFVTGKNGKPLAHNPLKDTRVRRAMSLALDRTGLVDRLLPGRAGPAGQLLPITHAGTSTRLSAPVQDLNSARALLAEAGYPDGFALTLHTPRNRYAQDMQTAHAVAAMLARIGIRVRVEALPADAFFKRLAALEFSFYLAGWSTPGGEASAPLRALIGTFDARTGMGQANRGRFSDAGVDALIHKAMTTLDAAPRNTLLASATEMAIGERQALIPLHHEKSTWALRQGFEYAGRSDQATFGFEVRLAQP